MSKKANVRGFAQLGDNATANFGTYNDVNGDQHNHYHGGHPLDRDTWPRSPKAAYNASLETLTREPCTKGTRVDILKRVYQWAADPSPNSPSIFWLTGQAGSGKSTIACTVAGHFDNDKGDSILGGNFFCSRQFEETRQRKCIIPALVYQLAHKSRPYDQALRQAPKNTFDCLDVPSKQMKNLLVLPWKQSIEKHPLEHPYLVVVDALDEVEGDGGSAFLRGLLETVDEGHLRGLKFFITSRPDPDLAQLCSSFGSDAVCRLQEVPTGTVRADIAKYLAAKLPALRGEPQLAELARKAGDLFVYAATVVRYITPRPKMTKGELLRRIKKMDDHASPISDTPSLIDTLYRQILWSAFSGLDKEELHDRLSILHTILSTEERVSTSVVGKLVSDSDDMVDMAELVVGELHAVLYIKDGRVLWYHTSFPDFVFSQERAKFGVPDASGTGSLTVDMSCDAATQHNLLARACFRVMEFSLQFNICDLPSPFLLDVEVPDLDRRVKENISDVLRYSCLYWGQHLERARSHQSLRKCINAFLRIRVLFWIEAINLLQPGALECAPILQRALRRAREWVLKGDKGRPSDLARDLGEAANFSLYFARNLAKLSTPHLYVSSLATWREDSTMSQKWKHQFSRLPSFKQDRDESIFLMDTQDIQLVSEVSINDGTRTVELVGRESWRICDVHPGATFLTALNIHACDSCISNSVTRRGTLTQQISSSCNESVHVYNPSIGTDLVRLSVRLNATGSIESSSDGTQIFSGSKTRSLHLQDDSTGTTLVANDTDRFEIESGLAGQAWDVERRGTQSISTPTNWVLWLPYHKDLMWVPPEAKKVLCRPHKLRIVTRAGSQAQVVAVQVVHSEIGMKWTECYTPSAH